MKKVIFSILAVACIFLFSNLTVEKEMPVITGDMPVAEVLKKLGDEPATHLPRTDVKNVSVEHGREIVLYGRTKSSQGGKSERVSKHFVCTSCHNIERDEPDLSKDDPMARLKYVNEKGLPFLQGSALYGIVDRRTFYNGDYKKKYGNLVEPARHNLREAIQLCATECSQGRLLEDWELESVLSYLWTIGLKMSDLNLSDGNLGKITDAVEGKGKMDGAIQLIKSNYQQGFPATFIDPPADRKMGFSTKADMENGKQVYELSCLHCHERKRYSFFNLDNNSLAFGFLNRHLTGYGRYSIYQVARYGTSPVPWKKAYMPHYTKEKMSEQMLEDLRFYIEQKAK